MSSKIINTLLETGKDLGLSQITIKEIELLNIEEIKTLDSKKIKKMRVREKLSQAVIAKILNVTTSTYQKWERGEVQPKGPSLKLLHLAYDHGVQYIIE